LRDLFKNFFVSSGSKPGSKAFRQDLSKFFEGKGKYAPWYRKQIKKKVKVEENEL